MVRNSLKNKKILITSGPTWIPIDPMRIISNKSSGQLGQIMALDLTKVGADITLLEGPVSTPKKLKNIKVLKFTFYDEFLKVLTNELKKKYDILIHAAAVSDYKLKNPYKNKLSSKATTLLLELVPTKKIINLIKKINPNITLVGFKLESQMTKALALKKTSKLFKEVGCDLVIANSFTNQKYSGYIINKEGEFLAHAGSRAKISAALLKILNKFH